MVTSLALSLLLSGLAVGSPVPDFSAPNQDGKVVKLSELKGKPVLVYFYPKDDTPGCTKEACSIRDQYARFTKAGLVILGISRQDAESHKAFRAKYHLPFDLLTDKDGDIAKLLGVDSYPLVSMHKRQSLLIDADGKLLEFYGSVDPEKHADEVLAKIEKPAPAAAPVAPAPVAK
jgi:peroxiredoxin Q/BCP